MTSSRHHGTRESCGALILLKVETRIAITRLMVIYNLLSILVVDLSIKSKLALTNPQCQLSNDPMVEFGNGVQQDLYPRTESTLTHHASFGKVNRWERDTGNAVRNTHTKFSQISRQAFCCGFHP